MWLAEQGWQVTGVDISDTALARAAAHAAERGLTDRVRFEQINLSESFPDGRFDLVSAQFLPSGPHLRVSRACAGAGGSTGHRRSRRRAAVERSCRA